MAAAADATDGDGGRRGGVGGAGKARWVKEKRCGGWRIYGEVGWRTSSVVGGGEGLWWVENVRLGGEEVWSVKERRWCGWRDHWKVFGLVLIWIGIAALMVST